MNLYQAPAGSVTAGADELRHRGDRQRQRTGHNLAKKWQFLPVTI
jgi:hypothetical protein